MIAGEQKISLQCVHPFILIKINNALDPTNILDLGQAPASSEAVVKYVQRVRLFPLFLPGFYNPYESALTGALSHTLLQAL